MSKPRIRDYLGTDDYTWEDLAALIDRLLEKGDLRYGKPEPQPNGDLAVDIEWADGEPFSIGAVRTEGVRVQKITTEAI